MRAAPQSIGRGLSDVSDPESNRMGGLETIRLAKDRGDAPAAGARRRSRLVPKVPHQDAARRPRGGEDTVLPVRTVQDGLRQRDQIVTRIGHSTA